MNVSNWLEKHEDFQPDKIALRIFKDLESEECWNYSFSLKEPDAGQGS